MPVTDTMAVDVILALITHVVAKMEAEGETEAWAEAESRLPGDSFPSVCPSCSCFPLLFPWYGFRHFWGKRSEGAVFCEISPSRRATRRILNGQQITRSNSPSWTPE